MTVESYNALALQVTTDSVNGCTGRDESQRVIDANLERVSSQLGGSNGFLSVFAGAPAKLVVLPEYFLTGFPMGESLEQWQHKGCIAPDGAEYERLQTLAQESRIFLSGNVYETDRKFPDLYFQTSFIIDDSGEVVCRYRRLISMFAPTPHDVLDEYLDHYGDDSLFPVADTALGRLACVASEEILYPEITRALTFKGAEVICHSSSEVGSELLTPKNVAKRARAYENLVTIVSANSAAVRMPNFPPDSTTGGSQIVDYKGQVLAEALAGESMTANAEIDIDGLRRSRRKAAMCNTLARQRFECFKPLYDQVVYPANNLRGKTPTREHFIQTQKHTIEDLIDRGVIK